MKKGIDSFTLKMIGILTMLIDHVGVILFPEYLIFRIIGRISFPIFTYTLVEGFMHTHDVKKYMTRLGIIALVSEIPFDLAFSGSIWNAQSQNVFLTLFLGIFMLYLMLKVPNVIVGFGCVLGLLLLSEFLHTDYSSMGLLMIYWFYQYRDNKVVKVLGIASINLLLMGGIQAYAILALIPILLHNGERGIRCKKFFYGFYPIHLLALYFISAII